MDVIIFIEIITVKLLLLKVAHEVIECVVYLVSLETAFAFRFSFINSDWVRYVMDSWLFKMYQILRQNQIFFNFNGKLSEKQLKPDCCITSAFLSMK